MEIVKKDLWQEALRVKAEQAQQPLILGGIEHVSITFVQRRKTPKRWPKDG